MTMNASINEDGSMSVNKYIQNKEVYKANKAACDADYEEFETYVDGLMEAQKGENHAERSSCNNSVAYYRLFRMDHGKDGDPFPGTYDLCGMHDH